MNRRLTKDAERRNPPQGQFLRDRWSPLALRRAWQGRAARPAARQRQHDPGLRVQRAPRQGRQEVSRHRLRSAGIWPQPAPKSSGLLDKAAKKYRVIVFDRPGYGHSRRPRGTLWTPEAQADLIHEALLELDATPAIVLGHSWGASVAVALGLKHEDSVKALVLASGYYYPTARVDVAAASGPAIPILGDILRYTLVPLLGRIIWPALMRKIFGPAEVPQKFTNGFPAGLALRPSQLRSSAAESALMIPDAFAMRAKYGELTMPVVIIAGELDRLIDTDRQSGQLHRDDRTQHLPFGARLRTHGAPDGHARSHGRNRRGGRSDGRAAEASGDPSGGVTPVGLGPALAEGGLTRAQDLPDGVPGDVQLPAELLDRPASHIELAATAGSCPRPSSLRDPSRSKGRAVPHDAGQGTFWTPIPHSSRSGSMGLGGFFCQPLHRTKPLVELLVDPAGLHFRSSNGGCRSAPPTKLVRSGCPANPRARHLFPGAAHEFETPLGRGL